MSASGTPQPAPNCRRCPRLAGLRRTLAREYPHYHGGPVTAFGPATAKLLVVGLAPGLHGAHRTGRAFSGDESGKLLFDCLHAHGFASQPVSRGPGDGLRLINCRVTNAVKCLPPDNRPTAAERLQCQRFLMPELAGARVILALGKLAHDSVVQALGGRLVDYPFAHGRCHVPGDGAVVLDSYHCSRYNVNTRRLTRAMLGDVVASARERLSRASSDAS